MLWGLDRVAFSHIHQHVQERDLTRVLAKVDMLSLLPFDKLQVLRDSMTDQEFVEGD